MDNNLRNYRHWLVSGAVLAIAALYVVLVYLPGRNKLAELREQLAAKQAPLDTSGAVLAAIAATEKELELTERFVGRWRTENPMPSGLAPMLAELHALAQVAGVSIVRLDPQPLQELDTIKRGSLTLTCTGSYRAVHRFLYQIEQSRQQIWVDSVSIRVSGGNEGNVIAEVGLVMFADNNKNSR